VCDICLGNTIPLAVCEIGWIKKRLKTL